jgi:hypothetical protein
VRFANLGAVKTIGRASSGISPSFPAMVSAHSMACLDMFDHRKHDRSVVYIELHTRIRTSMTVVARHTERSQVVYLHRTALHPASTHVSIVLRLPLDFAVLCAACLHLRVQAKQNSAS